MRLFLVLMLVHGLVPGLAEAAEAVVHYVRAGHVAHTAADKGDLGDQGTEHGCGATQHNCTCCPTQAIAQPTEIVVACLRPGPVESIPARDVTVAAREPARPFRPPIS